MRTYNGKWNSHLLRANEGRSVPGSLDPRRFLAGRRALVLACAISALLALPASDAPAHVQDKDCADFPTQRAAQDHGDTHSADPDDLDHDDDGTVCEELPCPCGPTPVAPAKPTPVRVPSDDLPLTTKAHVASVIDGDTLNVRLAAGAMAKVRLIGIDSPKRGGRGTRGQCGGLDATAQLKRLALRNGPTVTLHRDPAHDRNDRSGRLLAYVSARGVDLGRTMIASGLAKIHASGSDFARLSTYRNAQAAAKAAKRGVWRTCGGT